MRRGCFFIICYVINSKLIFLQFSQDVHNPKQWSPFPLQPSEVRFPSPLSEQTRTRTPLILESTGPKLPVLCFRASTTACRQTTPTQVPCGNYTVLFSTARLWLNCLMLFYFPLPFKRHLEKIQPKHLPQTLALRTTSTTLSKWRRRRIIRIG